MTWMRLLAGVTAMALALLIHADEPEDLEYQVKAVFLLRIAQFTEWPAHSRQPSDQPFVLCVLGRDPFGPVLEQAVHGERVNGQPIVVLRHAEPDQIQHCDLLFVAASHEAVTAQVLARTRGRQTLTVGDFEGFVGRGGAIEFYLEADRVRFRIDRGAAQAAGLSLRSQLLRAATLVKET